jgi:hypothetical protein
MRRTPPTPAALAEEERRLARLRRLADLTCAILRQARMSRGEGEALIDATRRQALSLFPGKEEVFDLVLAPRFRRILDERWPPGRARVLPFPRTKDED